MSEHNLSRRNFFGATAGATLAGGALAQSTGVNPADLPDLTIKEVKVYVLKPAEANTDFNPMLYYYHLRYWLSQFAFRGRTIDFEQLEVHMGDRTMALTLMEFARDGKHLGGTPGYLPNDRGFDSFYGLRWSNDMEPARGRRASAACDRGRRSGERRTRR